MAHNPAGHFHHGGIHDIYVYPDNYFNDVDHDHAGTAHLEHDHVDERGDLYVHVGTFNVDTEHGRRAHDRYLRTFDDDPLRAHCWSEHFVVPGGPGISVVHRRC